MVEARFFDLRIIYCEECRQPLQWQQREDDTKRLILAHGDFEQCSRSGKKYYAAPLAYDLTEFTQS